MRTPSCPRRLVLSLGALLLTLWTAWDASAQRPRPRRGLPPGILTTIPARHDEAETFSRHDLVEIRAVPNLQWSPKYTPESRTLFELSKGVTFRRPSIGLEFSFKPLRMVHVDIPSTSGKMQRKLIWYMVYKVTNRGGHLVPKPKGDGTFETEKVDGPVDFIPTFSLYSHEFKKEYLDRVIPVAIENPDGTPGPIPKRERPGRKLLNSVQIAAKPIPVSKDGVDRSVWGVVTWEDIDPRLDYISILIQGLSNAYVWVDPEGVYQHGKPLGSGRRFARKTLQLNFWRPGDEFDENEEEISFGLPHGRAKLYQIVAPPDPKDPKQQPKPGEVASDAIRPGVDYAWIYR